MALSISPTKIANLALGNIGNTSVIENLTTELSTEAKVCNLWYDISRLQLLEVHDWNFARKRLLLAGHADVPPSGVWAYRYQYPADAVMARFIPNPAGPDEDAIPFEIERSGTTKSVLTDLENTILVYTQDIETAGDFSPSFIEALGFLLAHHIAFSLTGDRQLKADLLQEYQAVLRGAQGINANESMGKAPRDAESIRARS